MHDATVYCVDCFRWTTAANTHCNNGQQVSTASTVQRCQTACNGNAQCLGFDWVGNKPANQRCWLTVSRSVKETPYNGVTHYVIHRNCYGKLQHFNLSCILLRTSQFVQTFLQEQRHTNFEDSPSIYSKASRWHCVDTSMIWLHVYVFDRENNMIVLMIFSPRHQIVNDTWLIVRHTIWMYFCGTLWSLCYVLACVFSWPMCPVGYVDCLCS